jgi:hypothetical protein
LVRTGDNPGTMVLLKQIVNASRPDQPPACIIVADNEETCVALSLYHLDDSAVNRLNDKDVFIVMDPVVKDISVRHGDKVRLHS